MCGSFDQADELARAVTRVERTDFDFEVLIIVDPHAEAKQATVRVAD